MKLLLLALFAFCASFSAFAGIRPSFMLDYSTWHSTHIVVATEGDEIDGKLTVIESWQGDLRAGDVVEVPDLAAFKTDASREVHYFEGEGKESRVKTVTGKRMVLFLIKKPEEVKLAEKNKPPLAPQVWLPADLFKQMNTSVIWIEGEKLFAFMQMINPGPSELVEYGESETKIKAAVLKIIKEQNALHAAIVIANKLKRAEALRSFANSDNFNAKQVAFDNLGACGKDALPVLREMLKDETHANLHQDVIKAMTVAEPAGIGNELITIVKDETAFWKATAPKLKVGWWNGSDDGDTTEKLRDRYGKVLETLYSLRKLKYAPCKSAVTEFRDFWRSLPQLEDRSGLNQMSEACDDVLRELP